MSEDKAPGTTVAPVSRSPRTIHDVIMPVGFRVNARDEQVVLVAGDVWTHPETKEVLAQYDGNGWVLTDAGTKHLAETEGRA